MLALRWAALTDAGAVAALLARAEDGAGDDAQDDGAPRPINAALAALAGWRGEQVERRMAELSVVMEAGLSALLGLRESGADPQSPAAALWHEFVEARGAIQELLERD